MLTARTRSRCHRILLLAASLTIAACPSGVLSGGPSRHEAERSLDAGPGSPGADEASNSPIVGADGRTREAGRPASDAGSHDTDPSPDGVPSIDRPTLPSPPTDCDGKLCVFPGATGFGAATPAGRGGQIIRVTTLADSGAGSLRAAIAASGPRIVVFEISGTIVLHSRLSVKNPYLTIAGQTAPSPGVTLRASSALSSGGDGILAIKTHDVLLRHLRIRTGDLGPSGSQPDGVSLTHAESARLIIDHCSISWGIDENLSTWYGPGEITVSNSIVSEALDDSDHPEGPHSKGFLIGDHTKNVALLGNLFAHNLDRNPFIKGGSVAVVVNNVFYNWGNGHATLLGSSDSQSAGPITAAVVGNVYLRGPSTPTSTRAVGVHAAAASGSQLFLLDNLSIDVDAYINRASFDPLVGQTPLWIPADPLPSASVETAVLARAGARPNDRDAVDRRIVAEVRARSGRIIDSQDDVGGWPVLASNSRTLTLPENPHADDDQDGYSNIEELLHQMAAAIEPP